MEDRSPARPLRPWDFQKLEVHRIGPPRSMVPLTPAKKPTGGGAGL
jgi:hypothetical protein